MVYTLRFFSLQNAFCFIILTYLVPVLFILYTGRAKIKKNNSGAKRLIINILLIQLKTAVNENSNFHQRLDIPGRVAGQLSARRCPVRPSGGHEGVQNLRVCFMHTHTPLRSAACAMRASATARLLEM